MTDHDRLEATSAAGPTTAVLVVRWLVGIMALGALLGWLFLGPRTPETSWPSWAAVLAIGIALRAASRSQRAATAVPIDLVAVGAATLLFSPSAAVAVAALVPLIDLLRDRNPTRTLLASAALTVTSSLAVAARLLADNLDTVQPTVVGPSAGGPGGIGVNSALVVTATLAGVWIVMRHATGWLDRRTHSGLWRGGSEIPWLIDVGLAALAVVAALTFVLYPPLAVLTLIPLLVAWRLGEGPSEREGDRATDALTGLGNTNMFRIALAEELSRSEQFDRPLAVLLVDIDDMGDLNATWGHEAGDEIVRTIAGRVRELARDYDVVARVGADSFAVVLPEATGPGARRVAERIRAVVAAAPVSIPTAERPVTVTVSTGVACFPGDGDDREGLLTEAELAASYAKLEGGDRVAEAARLPQGFHRVANSSRHGERLLRSRLAADQALGASLDDGDGLIAALGAPRSTTVADRASGRTGRMPAASGSEPPATEPLGPDRLVKVSSEPMSGPHPRTDRLLGIGVSVTAVVIAVSVALAPAMPDWGRLALFAALAIGAEWFAESIYGRANSSWSAVPLVALATLAGGRPIEIIVAGILSAFGGGVLRGIRSRQILFNSAVLVLSMLAGAGVVVSLGSLNVGDGLVTFAVIGLVAGSAFFVVDTWLVATAVAVATRSTVFNVWREDLLWLVPHHLGLGLLGGVMGYAYAGLGVAGAVVLVVPALGLHLAQRQFVRRTRENVIRLRSLNDDMSQANTRVVRVNERLTEALEQVNQGYLVTVESLAAAVDAKDSYTGSHIDRVEAYGRRMLEVLDPSLADDEALLWGFRLHDVGKIGVPDSVLGKTGPLTEDEWALMRRHPEIGAQIVAAAPFLQGAWDVILHHHERWDGRGYPYGLAEAAIPFSARLFTVIDAFDAMTSDRPYRKGMDVDEAIRELMRHQGTQFDPEMIEAFLQIDLQELGSIRDEVTRNRQDTHLSRSGELLIPIASEYRDKLLARP